MTRHHLASPVLAPPVLALIAALCILPACARAPADQPPSEALANQTPAPAPVPPARLILDEAPAPQPQVAWPDRKSWQAVPDDVPIVEFAATEPRLLILYETHVGPILKEMANAGGLTKLEGIEITETNNDEARQLAGLRLPALKHLDLTGCIECVEGDVDPCRLAVCSDGLQAVGSAPWAENLRSLELALNDLGPTDMVVLGARFPRLAYLGINAQNIGKDGRVLAEAKNLRHLQTLILTTTDLDFEGLRRILLSDRLPGLQYVRCSGCETDEPIPGVIGRFRMYEIHRRHGKSKMPGYYVLAVAE